MHVMSLTESGVTPSCSNIEKKETIAQKCREEMEQKTLEDSRTERSEFLLVSPIM